MLVVATKKPDPCSVACEMVLHCGTFSAMCIKRNQCLFSAMRYFALTFRIPDLYSESLLIWGGNSEPRNQASPI